ncbi:MAG: arginine--tRNA ligase [Bauldia litoralis]
MNVFAHFRDQVVAAIESLVSAGSLPPLDDLSKLSVEPPRDPEHGDIATNAAMVLSKPAGMKPRDLAGLLAPELKKLDVVVGVEIAGPGFINLRIADAFWRARVADILATGTAWGDSAMGAGEPVNVEYVSVNPTGLLHVGHARGAVFGDALAALLAKAGYAVTKEYYVNDAGGQIDALTRSFLKRLHEIRSGETLPDSDFEGLYPGEEVIDAAKAALADPAVSGEVEGWLAATGLPDGARVFAVAYMMDRIREDLAELGIHHDLFSSERKLVEAGAVDEVLAELESKGLIYTGVLEPPKGKLPDDWEERPQTLFRATDFGDDTDRPLRKSDGSWTYFATDIAYHRDKVRRGFNTLIDVWGADHGGYVKRMQAAVKAVTGGEAALDVKICQLVNLTNRGEPVKMSKRAGTVVTVRDVVEEVGRDVVRFIMLTRKNDAPLDFDFAKVTEQSKDNPVFYVQYAHARSHSVFRQAGEALPELDLSEAALASAPVDRLTDKGELSLIKRLAGWPRIIESAAEAHEPHRIAFYLYDIAADFHAHWNRGREDPRLRFVAEDDAELTLARLALVRAVGTVVASGLEIFGVEPVEEMR